MDAHDHIQTYQNTYFCPQPQIPQQLSSSPNHTQQHSHLHPYI